MFIEDVLIGKIDERYALDGNNEYVMMLPELYDPGEYLLTFRVDPFTEVASSVAIQDLQAGNVTIPEPTTLAFITIGGLAILRRRRAA